MNSARGWVVDVVLVLCATWALWHGLISSTTWGWAVGPVSCARATMLRKGWRGSGALALLLAFGSLFTDRWQS